MRDLVRRLPSKLEGRAIVRLGESLVANGVKKPLADLFDRVEPRKPGVAKRTKFLRGNSEGRRTNASAPRAPSVAPREDDEPQPVLNVVKRRLQRRASAGDFREDGCKLGLVVERGGMRGITSAGMLFEMHQRGMDKTIFDAVYGSSAGAINSTYYLAQDVIGADIYHKHIANKDFVSLSRLWQRGGKPVLDLSYLLDHVMERVLPLRWDKVLNSTTPLKMAATGIDGGGGPLLLEDFRDKQDLVECLRASASVPGLSRGPVHHRGHAMVDALVYEPVPVWSAVDDGCTHVLVLRTRPRLAGRGATARLGIALARNLLLTPAYLDGRMYAEADASARGPGTTAGLLAAEDPAEARKAFGADVYTIFPGSQPVDHLCIKVDKLLEARREGHVAVREMYDNHMEQGGLSLPDELW